MTGPQGFVVVPAATGNSTLRSRYERPLVILMGVVVLVLLIACANIANLLLARGAARRHELSVRCALGASAGRLVRQLFAESVVLAIPGAIGGLVIAWWGSRLIVRHLSTQANAVFLDLAPDLRVLAFTAAVSIVTLLIFGMLPALRGAHVAPMEALKEQGRGPTSDPRLRLTSGIVAAQVALSTVLVVAAGLFGRTFASLAAKDVGFDRDRVLLVNINAQRAASDGDQRWPLFERIRDAVHALPGVDDAALSSVTPPALSGGLALIYHVEVERGAPVPATLLGGVANGYGNAVSPGWFHALGMPMVAGRDFTRDDRAGSPRVAIVNQAFVYAFLGGGSALGRVMTLTAARDRTWEIVGVVGDSVYATLREPVPPIVYTPLAQAEGPSRMVSGLALSIRAAGGSPMRLTRSVAGAITTIHPDLTFTFRSLADQVDASLTQERLVATLSMFFGALALLLGALGLYGVTA